MSQDHRAQPSREEIVRAANALFTPGDVHELRILGTNNGRGTLAGYFNHPELLGRAAAIYSERPEIAGVYATLNPCDPALLARCVNRVSNLKNTTSDKDISRRVRFLIDIDPTRPSGVCATNTEKARALTVARQVANYLCGVGWPEGFAADSGNGFHITFLIDLANDTAASDLLRACLEALAARFDTEAVKVDTQVFTAARIFRVPGTVNAKGDSTDDRPHRTSQLLHVPKQTQIVSGELLQALADQAPKQTAKPPHSSTGTIAPEKIEEFLTQAGIAHRGRLQYGDGWKWQLRECWFNPSHTGTSCIVILGGNGVLTYHCSHASCARNHWHQFREGVEGKLGRKFQFVDVAAPAGTPKAMAGAVLRCFSEITPKPLRFLWRDRIPLGKLTLLAGDPGLGKSLITIDIASRVTRGTPFPDGAKPEAGSVIFLSAEDDAEDTIRPRLDLAGADVSRVHRLEAVRVQLTDGAITEKAFSLETDCVVLEETLRQHPEVRLVVIDPISSYLGGVDSNSNAEVRGLLAPLATLAAKFNVAVVLITHLRKSAGLAVYRAIASIAFMAAARASWAVAPDPDVDGRRLLVPVKQNLAPDIGGLAYHIEATNKIPRIVWEPGTVSVSANEVLGSFDAQDQDERREAKAWLENQLADGPEHVKKLQKEAKDAGLSWMTVRRAKEALSVEANKNGYQGAWQWQLKDAHSKGAHPSDMEVSAFDQDTENSRVNGNFVVKDAHLSEVSNSGDVSNSDDSLFADNDDEVEV